MASETVLSLLIRLFFCPVFSDDSPWTLVIRSLMAWVVVSMVTVVAVRRTRFAFIPPVGLHVCAATLLIKVKKIIIPSRVILRVLVSRWREIRACNDNTCG